MHLFPDSVGSALAVMHSVVVVAIGIVSLFFGVELGFPSGYHEWTSLL